MCANAAVVQGPARGKLNETLVYSKQNAILEQVKAKAGKMEKVAAKTTRTVSHAAMLLAYENATSKFYFKFLHSLSTKETKAAHARVSAALAGGAAEESAKDTTKTFAERKELLASARGYYEEAHTPSNVLRMDGQVKQLEEAERRAALAPKPEEAGQKNDAAMPTKAAAKPKAATETAEELGDRVIMTMLALDDKKLPKPNEGSPAEEKLAPAKEAVRKARVSANPQEQVNELIKAAGIFADNGYQLQETHCMEAANAIYKANEARGVVMPARSSVRSAKVAAEPAKPAEAKQDPNAQKIYEYGAFGATEEPNAGKPAEASRKAGEKPAKYYETSGKVDPRD